MQGAVAGRETGDHTGRFERLYPVTFSLPFLRTVREILDRKTAPL